MKDVASPHVTFSDKLSVFLGDLEIQLIFPGPNEADDNIIVFVPDRKVAFMSDTVGCPKAPLASHVWSQPVRLDGGSQGPGHARF